MHAFKFAITCTTLLLAQMSVQAQDRTDALPNIVVEMSGLIEFAVCPKYSGAPIDEDVWSEAYERHDEFANAWNSNGPRLLAETVALTGTQFTFRERSATLHACPDLPSLSQPLIVNIREFLASATDEPAQMSRFVGLLYHEVLHSYLFYSYYHTFELVDERIEGLPPVVRNHLILMAIEQAVYERLGLNDELSDMRKFYLARETYAQILSIIDDKGVDYFLAMLDEN